MSNATLLKRQQVRFGRANGPATTLLLRSVLCDHANPDKHLAGWVKALESVAAAATGAGRQQLQLSLDHAGEDVVDSDSVYFMLSDRAFGGDACTFEEDEEGRPLVYFTAAPTGAALPAPTTTMTPAGAQNHTVSRPCGTVLQLILQAPVRSGT